MRSTDDSKKEPLTKKGSLPEIELQDDATKLKESIYCFRQCTRTWGREGGAASPAFPLVCARKLLPILAIATQIACATSPK